MDSLTPERRRELLEMTADGRAVLFVEDDKRAGAPGPAGPRGGKRWYTATGELTYHEPKGGVSSAATGSAPTIQPDGVTTAPGDDQQEKMARYSALIDRVAYHRKAAAEHLEQAQKHHEIGNHHDQQVERLSKWYNMLGTQDEVHHQEMADIHHHLASKNFTRHDRHTEIADDYEQEATALARVLGKRLREGG